LLLNNLKQQTKSKYIYATRKEPLLIWPPKQKK
jgi:hypothetical protein